MGAEPSFDMERDLLCTVDSEGRFTTLNVAWERVLGWTREELMSRPFIEFVHPDDRERTTEEAARIIEPDTLVVGFENRYRTKAGEWRWLHWSARSDGQLWFAIAWDVTEQREAVARLHHAIEEDRLLAYSQPIIDLRGRSAQEELLVRLRVGEDVLLPADFVPVAERSGLIRSVDRFIFGRAISIALAGRCAEVNLSARSIEDDELAAHFEACLVAAPEAAARIVFELTETAAVQHFDAASEFARRMTRLGCRFALDDFGTGFGSLTYLRRLPVRFLKIDTSFVRNLPRSEEDQAVVRSIVAIAGELGQRTVAEGVEDAATLELLRGYGVDHAQGFHLGRPLPLVAA